ncbi:DUF4839 domain-containing protein, partial [Bacteroides congonensis]|uniref:DUF4839 domain-containing protein n=1 Tax=Bacteroides congonensis TaxID=1871006 RepID=UPI00321B7625
ASSAQKGRNYQDVIKDFESKGFTNIQVEPIDDLVTGWMTKDGEVEEVSVDGDKDYSPDRWYPNDVEVIITYHTFPEEYDGEEKTTPEETQSSETEEPPVPNLTVNNCEELATMLAVEAEIDSLYSEFAEAHKESVIEFDGCITYIVNHDDYDTRYDILLSAGDYIDDDTVNPGPVFKFEDVNTMNLGIEDLFLPEFVKAGSNIHVVAKVKNFNEDTGLFFLEPVTITER